MRVQKCNNDGGEVAGSADTILPAGLHKVYLNISGLAGGTYFLKIATDTDTDFEQLQLGNSL